VQLTLDVDVQITWPMSYIRVRGILEVTGLSKIACSYNENSWKVNKNTFWVGFWSLHPVHYRVLSRDGASMATIEIKEAKKRPQNLI
jgi:hypothetical protein